MQRHIQEEAFEARTIGDLPRPRDVKKPSSEAYIFTHLPKSGVNYDHRTGRGKPDFLERFNPREKPSLHWYSETGKDGEYRIKGTMAEDALEHLTNTLRDLATKNDGVCYNMKIQFLTREQAADHYHEADEAYQKARQSTARQNQHPGQPAARSASVRSALPPTRTGSQRPPTRPDQAKEATEPPPQTQNNPMQPRLICGNCKKPGHALADCVIANAKSGFVHGCPVCNDSEHSFDDCKARPSDKKGRWTQALKYMYRKRLNKPMILTHKYPWPLAVLQTVQYQMEESREALTFKQVTERLELKPPNHMYPWSTDFAREIMASESTAVVFRFQCIHPCTFDHQADGLERLPVDKRYHDKFGSFEQVLTAYSNREWKVPVPLTDKQERAHTDRGAHMAKEIRRLLDLYCLLPAFIQTAKGTELQSIKEEDGDDKPNPLDIVARYEAIRSKAREQTAAKRPEKPAREFHPPSVKVKSGQDFELIEIFEDDDEPMQGAPSKPVWASSGIYVGSTWNPDDVTYQLVDEKGDWCAYWAVWNYINLSPSDFEKFPRGLRERNKMKRLALRTIDDILLRWRQGQSKRR